MGIRERLLEEFKRQGLEAGRKEGIKNIQRKTAEKMLQSEALKEEKVSLPFIADITGFSLEEVLFIKDALEKEG